MSDDTQTDGLHLPSLSIRGFRGINRLDIGRLGRVTLLAGRNGVGKTTVLEAARVFAQRGSALCLYEFLMDREELESHADDDEERGEYPVFEALFHGRQPTYGSKISIGSADSTTALSIEAVRMDDLSEEWLRRLASGVLLPDAPVLKTVFNGLPDYQPVFDRELGGRHAASVRCWRTQRGGGDVEWPPDAACVVLGPGPPSNWDIAEFWDEIALTPSEPLALALIIHENAWSGLFCCVVGVRGWVCCSVGRGGGCWGPVTRSGGRGLGVGARRAGRRVGGGLRWGCGVLSWGAGRRAGLGRRGVRWGAAA